MLAPASAPPAPQVFETLAFGLQCPMCDDNGSRSKVTLAPSSDDFVTLYSSHPKAATAVSAGSVKGANNTAKMAYGNPQKSWVHNGSGNPYPRHY